MSKEKESETSDPVMIHFGELKSRAHLRSGKGLENVETLATLSSGTTVYVNEPYEALPRWVLIKLESNKTTQKTDGYIHKFYLPDPLLIEKIDTTPPATPPSEQPPAPSPNEQLPPRTIPQPPVRSGPPAQSSGLGVPESEKLQITADMNSTMKRLVRTWNEFGGVFKKMGQTLQIDPGLAVAVFVAESGGDGFRNGRMIIRFENHLFFKFWGSKNPEKFSQHFQYSPEKRWTGHTWRPTPNEPFRSFHGNQNSEWAVFEFARTLSDQAAKLSISMGAPQIMGFNHRTAGYSSVNAQFDAFASSMAEQIDGFFNFVEGNPNRVIALQKKDFVQFAKLYNGSGQAEHYGKIIRDLFNMFASL